MEGNRADGLECNRDAGELVPGLSGQVGGRYFRPRQQVRAAARRSGSASQPADPQPMLAFVAGFCGSRSVTLLSRLYCASGSCGSLKGARMACPRGWWECSSYVDGAANLRGGDCLRDCRAVRPQIDHDGSESGFCICRIGEEWRSRNPSSAGACLGFHEFECRRTIDRRVCKRGGNDESGSVEESNQPPVARRIAIIANHAGSALSPGKSSGWSSGSGPTAGRLRAGAPMRLMTSSPWIARRGT